MSIYIHTCRHIHRQAQTDRQADRHTDRQTHTHISGSLELHTMDL